MSYISDIIVDDSALPEITPKNAPELRVKIFDELQENEFILIRERAAKGPYKLQLGMQDRRLVFTVTTENDEPAGQFILSLSTLKQVIKDYFAICESYFKAVTSMQPSKIEAIDMGRRGIHDEGTEQLRERLEGKVETDKMTARRLFTLICALHYRG